MACLVLHVCCIGMPKLVGLRHTCESLDDVSGSRSTEENRWIDEGFGSCAP